MATPYSLVSLDVIDSTQDEARRRYQGTPVLVVAGVQRQGRGRRGREWLSAPRSVAASLCLDVVWPQPRLALIPLMAGVAAARAVGVGLKWPNDLFAGDRKVGGILVEATGSMVTAGVGLNLWWPDPPIGMGATHDTDPGGDEVVAVANRWAVELLAMIESGPDRWPRAEYLERCVTIGREITWEPDGRGVAIGVDADGGLVVDMGSSGRTTIRSGEVHDVRAV